MVKDMFMSGKDGRADRHKDAYVKLSTVPWRGMLIYVTRTSKYIDDTPVDGDLIEWKDTAALDVAGNAVDVAYAAAVSALLEYNYNPEKLRTAEVKAACGATIMNDDSRHQSLTDPMFAAIAAAMEEAEKTWNSVGDFEKAVEKRFDSITKTGRSKLNPVSKKGEKPNDAASLLNAIDPNIVCDGVKVVNDTASAGFMAMMEELKDFSETGPRTKAKKQGYHREKNL